MYLIDVCDQKFWKMNAYQLSILLLIHSDITKLTIRVITKGNHLHTHRLI